MRQFLIQPTGVVETETAPPILPEQTFLWIACDRSAFEHELDTIQATLLRLNGISLLDFHVSDLLNRQLPSRYDYTSQYDVLVFRRLGTESDVDAPAVPVAAANRAPAAKAKRSGPPVLRRIDTHPVGFVVMDHVLLTVHPDHCAVAATYAARLLAWSSTPQRGTGSAHLPPSPADLMLRLVNQMVDGYLDLRRDLTRQLDHWQTELLHPTSRFRNWGSLLDARNALHQLGETCEDQRNAVQDWIEALTDWEAAESPTGLRDLELLKVRSRDVLEHIERVVHHVQRLERDTETAVQMHFSVQGNRANEIMRTLTVLTAIFLPLNLIAGIFGMNFEFIPLVHRQTGFWWAMGSMAGVAVLLVVYFWRKRYLSRSER